ncbi:hypothetical protein AgCh_007032 [Apium graveolens]
MAGKIVIPVRKVWYNVSKRFGTTELNLGLPAGLLKLHQDVRTCEYEDVHVLWELLKKTESGRSSSSASGRKKPHSTKVFNWPRRDTALAVDKQGITVTATSRKLKDFGYSGGQMSNDPLNLEDYGPNDPSPSSKTSIRPGPIQHGTPFIPYIPRPSQPAAPPAPLAPGHPKLGALP